MPIPWGTGVQTNIYVETFNFLRQSFFSCTPDAENISTLGILGYRIFCFTDILNIFSYRLWCNLCGESIITINYDTPQTQQYIEFTQLRTNVNKEYKDYCIHWQLRLEIRTSYFPCADVLLHDAK